MNTPGTFAKGTRLWVNDRAATVLTATEPRVAQIVYDGAEAPETVDLLALYAAEALCWEPPASAPAPVTTELEQIPEAAWNEARRREELLRAVLDAADIERAIRETSASAKVSRATLYRWKGDYLRDGLRGLVPNTAARGGKGQRRLDKNRETLLDEVIHRVYLRRTRPTIRHTYEQIIADFKTRGLPPPALRTVRARLMSISAARRAARREGTKGARKHIISRGQFPSGTRPLQTILIDHTPLDIQLVDSTDRTKVIGRPYLTLAVDACTRMIYGYYLSLDPPSYLSVAMCVLQGALPKDDVLQRFNLAHPWPIFGLPETIHTDNGKDFRSRFLERFAAQYDITLEYRPVRTPHIGGLIERVVGTVNRYVHPLDGTTKSNVHEKGDYDAEDAALFTIEEIEEFLARRIVEHYHTAIHRELGKSPLAAWNEAMSAGDLMPTLPENPERFRIDILPFEERTIQKDGVAIHGLHYSDGVLQTWRARAGSDVASAKFTVKYDPRDLSRVYFVPPGGEAPMAVPLTNRSLGTFSMLELRRTQALAKAEHRTWSERTLPEMLQRERAALTEAVNKSKAARRDAARIRKSREATAAPTATVTAVVPAAVAQTGAVATPPVAPTPTLAPDDDWGAPVLRYRGDA